MTRPLDDRHDDWHELQDRAIDSSLDEAEATWASDDPVLRSFQFSGEALFYSAHLLPIVAEHPRDASFRVLDLGCGDGRTAHAIAEMFPAAEVIGVDANARSIDVCRSRESRPNLSFVHARFEELGSLGLFDVAVCSEVFEHVADIQGLLTACASAVRAGGLLTFSTPSGWIVRQPRLSIVRMAVRDHARWRLRAFPERDWEAALEHHPGTRVAVLRELMASVGFQIEDRRSGLVTVDRGSRSTVTAAQRLLRRSPTDNSLLFALGRRRGRSPQVQARRMYYTYMLVEALMNIVPASRFLESRTFLTLRRVA